VPTFPATHKAEWGCVKVNEKIRNRIQETGRFCTEIMSLTRINVGKNRQKLKESLDRHWDFQEVENPGISKKTNRHMKLIRLSGLSTGRLYPSGNIPGIHFCKVAHTRTSLARESASGSLTRKPGSDIHIYMIGQSPARDTPHTDEFDSLEPEPSRTR
jgi:hypothetical protein